MTTHFMNLNSYVLELIRKRKKTIEMRLYDKRRQKILQGDYIVFISTDDTNIQLEVKVKEIHRYVSFYELYKKFDKIALGYNENEVACPTDMEKYYSKNQIDMYGVIGIEVEI